MPAGNSNPNGKIPHRYVAPTASAPTTSNTIPTNFVRVLTINVTTRTPIYMKSARTKPPSNISIVCFVASCSIRSVSLEVDAL